ncbi:MAG: metallophosphoesterase [Candidatus Hydrogenedentes bacterium]|nr:metallophosphoesterase [Candidatus Hydrogenedentota bacterium]
MMILCATMLLAGAAPTSPFVPGIPDGPHPWTHLQFHNDPDNFQFAIMSDRTGGARPGVFEDGVRKLNWLQPELVMCVGDLVEGGVDTEAELREQWREFDSIIGQLEMPFFFVPGNHDVSNTPFGAKLWKERFGHIYYHFLYKNVLFIGMNTDDADIAQFSDEQINYVTRALNENPNVRWTLLFMHKPIWTYEKDGGWSRIEEALKDRKYTVIVGHTHDYMKYERLGREYFVLATTGGSMAHAGPLAGEFDEVAWVTMSDEGPRLVNLTLAGILHKDVRTAEQAALIQPVLDGKAIGVVPAILDKPRFTGGAIRLRLQNPATLPMHVEGTIAPTPQLTPQPSRIRCDLAAKGNQEIEVKLVTETAFDLQKFLPLASRWQFTFEPPEKAPIAVPIKHRIVIDAPFDCPLRASLVTVDGSLSDWAELPFVCLEPGYVSPNELFWDGPGDASFRFALAHDEKFMYVAIEVTDDKAHLRPNALPTKQDGVEIRVDARANAEELRAQERATKSVPDYLRVAVSPRETADRTHAPDRDKWPAGVVAADVLTSNGHVAEVAVPISHLENKQGGRWNILQINLTIYDYDEAADTGTALWWRPDWNSAAHYPGSGTFRRAGNE